MENKTFESGQYEQSYDQPVMHHQPMVTQTTVHPAQDVVIVAQPRSYGQPQNQTDWNEGLCGCLSDCGSCKKVDGIYLYNGQSMQILPGIFRLVRVVLLFVSPVQSCREDERVVLGSDVFGSRRCFLNAN